MRNSDLDYAGSDRGRIASVCAVTIILALALCGVAVGAHAAAAQDSASTDQQHDADALSKWQWFHEVPLPEPGKSPWGDFLLPVAVFDESREDLGDLRLYDGRGNEVPYALRVRQTRDEQQQLTAKEFNRRTQEDHSIEVTLDLSERPAEHNELEVATRGVNFRRQVVLEGSDNQRDWGKLVDAWLVHYQIDGQGMDVRRLRYPPSRFRYLRVRVFPDRSQGDDAPGFLSLAVYHTVREPGEYVTRPAQLGAREAVRAPDGPGSAWIIDLGGRRVPCERLSVEVPAPEFARPYVLEMLGDEGPAIVIARGELRRYLSNVRQPLEIALGREVRARRLRLVVTDHSNPPLRIDAVKYTAAAREVIFARAKDLAVPLRLYAGNPAAGLPHYDFAATLPAVLNPPPGRTSVGEAATNPIFVPEPKPWTERWPGLIYVVLAASSLVLLAMLGGLARAAMRRHDAAQAAAAG